MMRNALIALLFVAAGRARAQRYPDFPPARVGAIVYVTPLITWKHAILYAVDSNSTVRARSESQLDWPSRLKPEQPCRTTASTAGQEKPLSANVSVLAQQPLDVSVEPDGSSASEIGTLMATKADTAVLAAHYLRVWRRDGRDWRVVFACTSPIREP